MWGSSSPASRFTGSRQGRLHGTMFGKKTSLAVVLMLGIAAILAICTSRPAPRSPGIVDVVCDLVGRRGHHAAAA